MDARVELSGTGAGSVVGTRSIELQGPGDVVGFDGRAVVRTFPPPNTFEAEPNLFPLVELAAPDLPWRHSPVPPDASQPGRLQPWLTLIVARDDGESPEVGDRRPPRRTRPLPSVVVAPSALPPLSQAAAWAHVHVVGEPEDASSLAGEDPSRVVARLLCPRRLEPRAVYRAFVVPAYAQGVRAGLGEDPDGISAVALAWDAPATPSNCRSTSSGDSAPATPPTSSSSPAS